MTFKMHKEDRTITVYNLRSDTQEFIGAGDAYIPAHTGLPAYCTDIEPIKAPIGKVSVFDSSKSIWLLVDDYRGSIVFDTATGCEIIINDLGPLPENTTLIAPDGMYQKWNGNSWEKDEEAEKVAKLSKASNEKEHLMLVVNNRILPLQDAVDLDMATDSEKQLLMDLKKYRILLNRVDLNKPEWPNQPE